ncbi:MAG: hypothetical protein WDW36_001598 [Sanguina aurantia]
MFPRKVLSLPFAVLLMRAAYDAVDDLDFLPMEKFQKLFWKLRASEQPSYTLQYAPLAPKIGDLSDPLYFDFISYCQFATISQEMPNGALLFQELQGNIEDQKEVLVRRDPAMSDNALLPAAFQQIVGDKVYQGLWKGYRGEEFGGPAPLPAGAPVSEFITNVTLLLDIMVSRGYALKGKLSYSEDKPLSFQVKVQGAATLWGLAALNYRHALVANTYDAMVISAYARACGRTAEVDIDISDTVISENWELSA